MFGYWEWAGVCERVGEHDEAVGLYGTVVELFETASDEGVATQPSFVSMAAKSYESIARLRDIRDGNWSAAERRLRAAVDLYTRVGQGADAADAEVSLNLAVRRSGRPTDTHRIQELCALLEQLGDPRAVRARDLVNELGT